ncbi:MAG TPA: hypothetical protein VML55_10775 [Planctomycetaceae bacterium]|nr:hypothetical protein [Planctomycetaceae bacterium]
MHGRDNARIIALGIETEGPEAMSDTAAGHARRGLARLMRAIEKAHRELAEVDGALRHAEGSDFPTTEFADAQAHLAAVTTFIEEQEQRLQDKILHAGGLEAGRVRRTGG